MPPEAIPAAVGTPETVAAPPAGTETPPVVAEPQKAPEKAPDPLSPRYAQLARQTKALATEKQRLAAERASHEAQIKAREDAIAARQSKYEEWETSQKKAIEDPGQHMRRLYGDQWYDRLTEYKLKGETAPPADLAVEAMRQETKAEIERIRLENENRWKTAEDERKKAAEDERARLTAQQTEAIDRFHSETIDFVKANAEKYELTNLNGAHNLVIQVIEQAYEKTGRIMTPAEAAESVEKHLEGMLEQNFASKRWAARLEAKKAAEATTEPPSVSTSGAKTITNSLGGTSGTPAPRNAEDRYARAVKAMEEQIARATASAAR